SRRRHTRSTRDWSSDVCSSDLLDIGVPCVPNQLLYVFFPMEDAEQLPDLDRLHSLARLGAGMVRSGAAILSHCGMGHNRSALLRSEERRVGKGCSSRCTGWQLS